MATSGPGLINLGVGLRLDIQPVANLRARRGDDSGQRPGTFTSVGVQDQLIANKEIGTYLRSQVGIRTKNHIAFGRRASASTGNLFRASINPRNEQITKERISVGIASYLEGTAAGKYYRIFEQGTQGFIGTPLLFFSGKKAEGDARGSRRVPFPVAHGMTPGIRTSRTARSMVRVGREIEPANIYEQVFNDFKPEIATVGLQAAIRYLDRFLAQDIVVAGKGFTPPST